MKTGSSIQGALTYNEQKVRSGEADLILASGFLCDVEDLNFSEKLSRFNQLIQRNEKVKNNTLHLSLNFSPDERLSDETLQKIAFDYMEKIGFAVQPFLVYRHEDTFHPHIHIVTTPIQTSGKSIYLHNIGKRMSEPARKQIELEYNLIKAEDKKHVVDLPIQPVHINSAIYGQSETKRVISNIVREVISGYKFSSFEEFNAILRQFNVIAERGNVMSSMYQNNGLVYSILDKDGFKIGVSIKASSIYTNPTLGTLYKKFDQNKVKKLSTLPFTKSKVGSVLRKSNNADEFTTGLKNKNIQLFVNRDLAGDIKEINFIDNKSRVVFTTQEMGMNVDFIMKKLRLTQDQQTKTTEKVKIENKASEPSAELLSSPEAYKKDFLSEAIKGLLANDPGQGGLQHGQKKKRRKKRKH
jgi:hypothetical protein